MLQYAISLALIVINVAKDVEVIGRRDEGTQKIMSPDKEVMKQLIALADEDCCVKLTFASVADVRANELHALRWRHISFERREVRIETRVDSYRDEHVTKTKGGLRTVPLAESVVAEFKPWRKRTPFKAETRG
jgi:integrase